MNQIDGWLAPIKAQIPPDLGAIEAARLQQAITEESMARFGQFMAGIKAYQSAPDMREAASSVETLWEKGTTNLLDYAPGTAGPVILVVPSLVNRFDILDIDPSHSFLRFLAGAGFRPLVVDWGEPGEEERAFSIDAYVRERLLPILDFATADDAPCHLMGYCMGGILAMALALLRPARVRTLSLIATPWDFSAGVGGVPGVATSVGALFMQQALQAQAYLERVGKLPASLLQGIFTSFQPLQMLQKFMRIAGEGMSADDMRRFALTEDWLNDGVPLALPVARECLRDWYDANLTARGVWSVGGTRVDPAKLKVPTYVLMAERDRLVPPEAAKPLAAAIQGAELNIAPLGHIGLMTADAAPEVAWKPLAAWLKARQKESEAL